MINSSQHLPNPDPSKATFWSYFIGISLFVVMAAVAVNMLPKNSSVKWDGQGVVMEHKGDTGITHQDPNKSASAALGTFESALDNKIKSVYRLLNSELQSSGRRTDYADTLTYVLLELLDIKYEKLDLIKGECNNDPECMKTKFAERNAFIDDLARRLRIPLSK